ncbi:amidohydrolase family protein [Amycolatopsis albispora]|uniref:Amidohydrolase n=1 Tax=Amycolatopsis albispora TaxID=1804986 RepID=A0A344L1E1_9PSEU|nr:amidohydrolase family protein [Amycolatopsis albispora]AXB41865.1 amidohydrolase [Amycolatopsis albispora]
MIDFHTHPPAWHASTWLGGAEFGPGEFLDFLNGSGIEAAVVLAHDGLFNATPEANDDLARFTAADPGRMIAFGTVNPRHAGAPDEVRRCFTELGFGGLKLHPWLQGFSMHETALDAICEEVESADGILLSHDGSPPYSMPGQIAALARRHPRVPVVLGHGGLHDCWREALAATIATPNLYLCLCGTPPYAARHILAHAPAGKVLFGTDAGLSDRASQDYAVARIAEIDGWGITARQREEMLVTNPRRLLGGWLG